VLSQLVTEVRPGEYHRIHALIADASPEELRAALEVLSVERMRTPVTSISGQGRG